MTLTQRALEELSRASDRQLPLERLKELLNLTGRQLAAITTNLLRSGRAIREREMLRLVELSTEVANKTELLPKNSQALEPPQEKSSIDHPMEKVVPIKLPPVSETLPSVNKLPINPAPPSPAMGMTPPPTVKPTPEASRDDVPRELRHHNDGSSMLRVISAVALGFGVAYALTHLDELGTWFNRLKPRRGEPTPPVPDRVAEEAAKRARIAGICENVERYNVATIDQLKRALAAGDPEARQTMVELRRRLIGRTSTIKDLARVYGLDVFAQF
ncbi:hypothetical protein HYR54_02325 [Candidatus Acetothermia bacterium]|nr:hypothetical protein [Candidatus Acetothermia bacterium]